ncbi:hypothetical protein KEM09_00215 [Carboxylicivirga mesophila]|uniref:BIG2 domain-containing protein n=1 Tax=Carboxylicivirga mesophila TaxID=1166478 RepID=A0ABS5K5J6_9BACT|nr:hypothetical protein [Carboxylicivirga mesophila]MBS2209806.1 hypothetical protein [Carboxylicivirga mesophila]
MKRNSLFKSTHFSIVIFMLFAGCSKDDEATPKLTVITKEVLVQSGETQTIVVESDFPVSFFSANGFHATINKEGIVKGYKVGKTEIIVECEGEAIKVPVETIGNHNLFKEPILDWTLKRTNIISAYGTPDVDKVEAIGYQYSGTKGLFYYFDELTKVEGVLVLISKLAVDSLIDYLDERYVYIGNSDGGGIILINAYEPEEASTAIRVVEDEEYIIVAYFPISSLELKSIDKANEPITEIIRHMLSKIR